MALPERWTPLWNETEDTIRERLLAAVPEGLSTVDGTFARDFVEICVGEFARLYARLNVYMSYRFIRYCWGPLLDAHGENYGVPRLTGSKATGNVRFTGDEGLLIGPSTLVGVPTDDPDAERAVYQTLNIATVAVPAVGYVDIAAEAVLIGEHANQAAGAVTLLESPDVVGITALTNVGPMTGGSNPEADDSYKERVIQAAALSPGPGTLKDHIAWALEKPGVAHAAAQERWDTSGSIPGVLDGRENGTVILSLRGPSYVAVDWSELQEVQKYIDPDRQVIALLEEGEPWTGTLTWGTSEVQTGEKSMIITNGSATTTVVQLSRSMDLSRFLSGDDFYMWLKSDAWQNVSANTRVRFYTDDTNYYEAKLSNVASGEPAKPSTDTDAWWRWRVEKGSCTVTGAPAWSAINKIEIAHVSTGAAVLTVDYWSIRHEAGALPEGRAPVGQSVTVVAPVPKTINVTASVTLDPGYTLTGATGTANATDLIQTALERYLRTLEPGQPVLTSQLHKAISNTPGVLDVILRAPGAVTVSNGSHTLPTTPVTGESMADFLTNGTAWLNDQKIAYTGKTGTTLTGVTGGSGIQADNSPIRQSEVPVSINQYPVLGTLSLSQ